MTAYGRQRIPGPIDGAAAFVPPTIGDTVAAWWADDLKGAVVDGGPVDTWVGRGASASLTASGSERPTMRYVVSPLTDRAAVEFNGITNIMSLTSALTTSAVGTVVAVLKPPTSASNASVWGASNTSGALKYIFGKCGLGTLGRAYVQASSGAVKGGTELPTTAPIVLEWSSNDSAWAIRLNNTTQSLSVESGANTGDWFEVAGLTRFVIGASRYYSAGDTTNSYLSGQIAYLLVTDSVLSVDDRVALYGWISYYYGMSVA